MADLEQYQNKLKEEYGQYMGKKLVSDDTNPVPGDSFRRKDVEGRHPGGGWVRVVEPNQPLTKDLRRERINFKIENGVVSSFEFF